jgi:hypothetical protein
LHERTTGSGSAHNPAVSAIPTRILLAPDQSQRPETKRLAWITTFWLVLGRSVRNLDTPLDFNLHKLNRLSKPGKGIGASPDTRRNLSVVPLIWDKRYYGEVPARLRRDWRPVRRKGAGRVAVGEGPEAGFSREPTRAGGVNRHCGNRQRSKAEAQPGHGFCRQPTS